MRGRLAGGWVARLIHTGVLAHRAGVVKNRGMRRRTLPFLVPVLLLAACSGDSSTDSSASQAPDVTESVTATEAPVATDAPVTTEAPTTTEAPSALDSIPEPPASSVSELLALGRPIVLAHASGEESHPHSSLYGYVSSAIAGVDVLDFDLWLTSDGVLVVHHDSDTGRTANEDLVVAESTYDQLHVLDNAYWFTDTCTCTDQDPSAYLFRGVRTGEVEPPAGFLPDHFAIAAFEDVLKLFPGWVLNIEIKGNAPESFPAADELARLLEEYDALDRAVVTSFDDEVVQYFHDLAPTVAMTPGLDMATNFVLGGVNPPEWATIMQVPPVYEGIEVFTPTYVAAAEAAGLITWVWPNGGESYELYSELLALGADGVNAANPPEALRALDDYLATNE